MVVYIRSTYKERPMSDWDRLYFMLHYFPWMFDRSPFWIDGKQYRILWDNE